MRQLRLSCGSVVGGGRTKSRSSLILPSSGSSGEGVKSMISPSSTRTDEPGRGFPLVEGGGGFATGVSSSSSSSMTTSSELLLCPLDVEAAFPFPLPLDGGFPLIAGDAVALLLPLFLGSGSTTCGTSSSSSSTTTGGSFGGFRCLVVIVVAF